MKIRLSLLWGIAVLVLTMLSVVRAMDKGELVDAIAQDAGISKADAKRALDGFVDVTSSALKKGDRVSLVGFGSFFVSKLHARTGRNPQTGKEIKIAAKNVVKFKAGAALSEKVNRRRSLQASKYEVAADMVTSTGAILDFQKPDKLVYQLLGNIPGDFLQVIANAKVSQDQVKGAVEKFDKANGTLVAFDSPETGIECSLRTSLEHATDLSRSVLTRFIYSFRNVINDELSNTDKACGSGTYGQVKTIRTADCQKKVVNVRGMGTFYASWTVDKCSIAAFKPAVEFGADIINALRDTALDLIEREANNMHQISRAVLADIECHCSCEDGVDDDCNIRECDGLGNKCNGVDNDCNKRDCNGINNDCDGVDNDCNRASDEIACCAKTAKRGATDGRSLLWGGESIVAFADDYGDRRGKLVGLCGNLRKVITEEGFLATYQDFFANVLKNGDATRGAGTRVRKGMQELKRLLRDIRKEVQAMKNK
jgi:DNA-binding protein HU-beta